MSRSSSSAKPSRKKATASKSSAATSPEAKRTVTPASSPIASSPIGDRIAQGDSPATTKRGTAAGKPSDAAKPRRILGQPSFTLETASVSLAVTVRGGQMAPVRFFRDTESPFEPYAVAPWAEEPPPAGLPNMLQALRGDFFCLPFGGNDAPWRGEQHPPHGETANADWALGGTLRTAEGAAMEMMLRTTLRPGLVRKRLVLIEGETNVYSHHRITEMTGPMCFGHHATLRFPDQPGSGLVATSPFLRGQVYPGEFEKPEEKGYSILKPGALFDDLARVERRDGSMADLTRYPARRGYEDLVMLCASLHTYPAWSAVTFPSQEAVWFALKDPTVLVSTILWHDNGGRHYPPWNGRSVNTLGIEDVTAHFHDGLAKSSKKNLLRDSGIPTAVRFSTTQPFSVPYIQGVARVPRGFGRVAVIEPEGEEAVRLVDEKGRTVRHAVRWGFLREGKTGIESLDE